MQWELLQAGKLEEKKTVTTVGWYFALFFFSSSFFFFTSPLQKRNGTSDYGYEAIGDVRLR